MFWYFLIFLLDFSGWTDEESIGQRPKLHQMYQGKGQSSPLSSANCWNNYVACHSMEKCFMLIKDQCCETQIFRVVMLVTAFDTNLKIASVC